MPVRKEVTRLEVLCLKHIAGNVCFHAKQFHRSWQKNESLYATYKFIQRRYSGALLNMLVEALLLAEDRLMWRHKGQSYRISLHLVEKEETFMFLFNEFTQNFYVTLKDFTFFFQDDFFPNIICQCKELRTLDFRRSHLGEITLILTVPQWSLLYKVNLSQTNCGNAIVLKIWDDCPLIQELILTSTFVSDECLLYLCSQNFGQGFQLCSAESLQLCGKHARQLEVLDVMHTGVTELGVLFALTHLPLLQYLYDGNRICNKCDYNASSVSRAILNVKQTQPVTCIPDLRLRIQEVSLSADLGIDQALEILRYIPQLTRLRFSLSLNIFRSLNDSTPKYLQRLFLHETSQEVLNSSEFKLFFTIRGRQIKTFSLSCVSSGVDLRCIVHVLSKCPNLQELELQYLKIVSQESDAGLELPSSVENITTIRLFEVNCVYPCSTIFPQDFLFKAKGVKKLEVSTVNAEDHFSTSITQNKYTCLEKLVFCEADMSLIAPNLKLLLTKDNVLRKITCLFCDEAEVFASQFRELVKKNNFDLQISAKCKYNFT